MQFKSVNAAIWSTGLATALLAHIPSTAWSQAADGTRTVPGQNDAQNVMANSIDLVCPGLAGDFANTGTETQFAGELRRICGGMIGVARSLTGSGIAGLQPGFDIADADEFNGALQSIAGEEMQTPQLEVSKVRNNQVGAIRGRLSALRASSGTSQLALDGFDRSREYQVVQATDDIPILEEASSGRFGVFISGGYRFGEKDNTDQVEGFDFDNTSLTAGADYRVSTDLIMGIAFGYSKFNVDFDETVDSPNGQEMENDTYSVSLYGTYYATDAFYLDGVIRSGYGDYASDRHIFISNPGGVDVDGDGNPDGDLDRNARGSFDSLFVDVGVRAGYDISLGGPTITPSVGLDYVYAEIDSFEETGAGGLNLAFEDQEAESLTATMGVAASYPISLASGVLTPSVNAGWVFELAGDDDGVEFSYAADTTAGTLSRFEIEAEDKDSNFGELGASLALSLPNDFSAFVDYSTIIALEDIQQHSVFVGVRKGF